MSLTCRERGALKAFIYHVPLSGFPYCNLINLPPSIEVIPCSPLRDTLSCCIGLNYGNQHQPLFVIITSILFIKVLKKVRYSYIAVHYRCYTKYIQHKVIVTSVNQFVIYSNILL